MLHKHIKVVDFGVIEGKGLIASQLIRKGEVVSRLETNQPMTLISEVLTWTPERQDELLFHGYQCSETHIVSEQGDERFMNHSCDPNTWWSDDDTMIARRDILPGEELTYDYSTTELTIDFEMPCHCGSALCRDVISNHDYLDPQWQARFGNHLPLHLLKAIATASEKMKVEMG